MGGILLLAAVSLASSERQGPITTQATATIRIYSGVRLDRPFDLRQANAHERAVSVLVGGKPQSVRIVEFE